MSTAITTAELVRLFEGMGDEAQLSLIATLVDRLPDDLHDHICDGLHEAAYALGESIAADEDMTEYQAEVYASDFAFDLLCKEKAADRRSRQYATRTRLIDSELASVARRLNRELAA